MSSIYRCVTLCVALALLLALAQPAAGGPAKSSKAAKAGAAGLIGPLPTHGEINISANGLHIQPGKTVNYLRFDNGVEIDGPGFALRADVVEMDVLSSALGLKDVKLPELSVPPERVIADPGSTVQRMVGEIRGPSAKFEASALERIAASGNIRISAAGAQLTTGTIFSSDGGQSWSTGGPAQLTLQGQGKAHGQQASFSAGLISFNSKTQELLARGAIHGAFSQAKQPAVTLDAAELRGNLATGVVDISGGIRASSGTTTFTTAQGADAPPVHFNIKTNALSIDGAFSVTDADRGLSLTGGGATADIGGQQISASGPVHITSTQDKLDLTANRLEATLEPLRLVASGTVHLGYGSSSYDAAAAVVTRQGKKLIVDIDGKQTGRIDLEGLKTKPGAKQKPH